MEAIQTAVSTAFQSVQTNVSSMITTCAPYALGIIGTVMAVTIGIKAFKKIIDGCHVRLCWKFCVFQCIKHIYF